MPLIDKHFLFGKKGSDFTGRRIIKAFRLTEDEARNLTGAAKCHGLKESDYIRECISKGPENNKEIVILLHDLMNEVNRVGRNINQIVKNNNSGLYLQSDKYMLEAYMRRLSAGTQEVINKIYSIKDNKMEDFNDAK